MARSKTLFDDECVTCHKGIEEGEGRFNHPSGVQCSDCGDPSNPKNEIKIGGYKIPTKLFTEYLDVVSHTRRAGLRSTTTKNPKEVMNALKKREELHRKIFEYVGLDYHHDTEDRKSLDFQAVLSDHVGRLGL